MDPNAPASLQALYAPNIIFNSTLQNVKFISACFTGAAAGILGLQNLQGFLFFIASTLLTSALTYVINLNGRPSRYLVGFHQAASGKPGQSPGLMASLSGALELLNPGQDNAFTFVLMWTLFYGIVHGGFVFRKFRPFPLSFYDRKKIFFAAGSFDSSSTIECTSIQAITSVTYIPMTDRAQSILPGRLQDKQADKVLSKQIMGGAGRGYDSDSSSKGHDDSHDRDDNVAWEQHVSSVHRPLSPEKPSLLARMGIGMSSGVKKEDIPQSIPKDLPAGKIPSSSPRSPKPEVTTHIPTSKSPAQSKPSEGNEGSKKLDNEGDRSIGQNKSPLLALSITDDQQSEIVSSSLSSVQNGHDLSNNITLKTSSPHGSEMDKGKCLVEQQQELRSPPRVDPLENGQHADQGHTTTTSTAPVTSSSTPGVPRPDATQKGEILTNLSSNPQPTSSSNPALSSELSSGDKLLLGSILEKNIARRVTDHGSDLQLVSIPSSVLTDDLCETVAQTMGQANREIQHMLALPHLQSLIQAVAKQRAPEATSLQPSAQTSSATTSSGMTEMPIAGPSRQVEPSSDPTPAEKEPSDSHIHIPAEMLSPQHNNHQSQRPTSRFRSDYELNSPVRSADQESSVDYEGILGGEGLEGGLEDVEEDEEGVGDSVHTTLDTGVMMMTMIIFIIAVASLLILLDVQSLLQVIITINVVAITASVEVEAGVLEREGKTDIAIAPGAGPLLAGQDLGLVHHALNHVGQNMIMTQENFGHWVIYSFLEVTVAFFRTLEEKAQNQRKIAVCFTSWGGSRLKEEEVQNAEERTPSRDRMSEEITQRSRSETVKKLYEEREDKTSPNPKKHDFTPTEGQPSMERTPASSEAPSASREPDVAPALPCHNVPGLWSARLGNKTISTFQCAFEIDDITAKKWGIPHPRGINDPPRKILPSRLSVHICCYLKPEIEMLMQSLTPGISPQEVANKISGLKQNWPSSRDLVITVQPKTPGKKTWLSYELGPGLDIAPYIHQGNNIVEFVQLSNMSDHMFVLLSAENDIKPILGESQA
ncbi:hypothetical protein CVT24_012249 [Panaeolus cyanescens]|uniref:ER membrane protein complex subunit 6 n=1 Tax=Panaeolus cyanescens TaxID=181874 RepID=A0A409W5R2_9AGAR|nr:hypothetical protein CVT24_012249 [Panaeolus cyanescens]